MVLPSLPSLPDTQQDDNEVDPSDPQYLVLPDPAPGVLRQALKYAQLSFNYLNRPAEATKQLFLYGNGTITSDHLGERVKSALKGELQTSAGEFANLMLGKDTMAALDRTPVIPGWVKTFVFPEHWETGVKDPLVSLGDVTKVGLEMSADPLLWASFTPVSPALGKLASIPFRPVTRFLNGIAGPGGWTPLAFINFLRDPERVLSGAQRPIWEALKLADDKARTSTHMAMQELEKSAAGKFLKDNWRKEGNSRLAAALRGLGMGADGKVLANGGAAIKLTAEEQSVAAGLKDWFDKWIDEPLRKSGKLSEEMDRVGMFSAKSGENWLDNWLPRLSGNHFIPEDIWQSWSAENLGRVALRLRGKGGALGAKAEGETLASAGLHQFDVLDDMKDLLYGARRKMDLEPAMLKYAPKTAAMGGRVAEDPAVASAGRVQRRYLTDIINKFQGNARGRKGIEFDLMAADVMDRIAQTPVGGRVLRLMEKLSGARNSIEGPDMTLSSKITGLITHNVLRNAIGGRLSTGVQNAFQITNFAVSRGLPATFKGLLRFSDRGAADARKAANLMGDFQSIFDDGMWQSWLGKTADKVLFGPMTVTERFVRGTGFHVEMDAWMKKAVKGGYKTIQEVKNAGRFDEMVNAAHLESINGSFLYGTLGRAPFLQHPLTKAATILTSYPMKQAEFLADTFRRDGSAFIRFLTLHGFLIEQMNKQLGIAGEDFLGWGFKPMTTNFSGVPLMLSPPGKTLLASTQAFSAWAHGDREEAERQMKAASFGMEGTLQWMGTLGSLGLSPLPALAIRTTMDTIQRLRTGKQELGNGFVQISRADAIADYLASRTTVQKARQTLHEDVQKSVKKVDWTLDKRVKALADAAMDPSHSGDKLGSAAHDLVSGINIEGGIFYPEEDQIQSRLDNYIESRVVPKDLRVMNQNQFLASIYLAAQLEVWRKASTGVNTVHTPSGRGVDTGRSGF